MGILNFIHENIILPFSDLVLGRTISRDLLFLNNSQWFSKPHLEAYQNEKLSFLIQYAYKNVPYYKNMLNNLKLDPKEITSKKDLNKLPILTKSKIKKEGILQFTSTAIPAKELIKSGSSGSTGEPLFYYITKEAYSMNIASSLRGWYWMGYRLGDNYIKLSQNPRNSIMKRFQDKINNNLYLATNPLTELNYKYILTKIEQYKPKIIRCYPDPLLFLARYMKDHNEFNYQPVAIATTGNTLFPETRQEIEGAFRCKIFDSYSCEGNSTVFECPTHSCYHSTEEYGISEVIDENGIPISKGIGKLISTDLMNLGHPFIRYDTQDYVEIDSEPCVCGRNHLKILRILGRDNDVIEMASGRKFIVHNFTGFFQMDIPEIKRSVNQFQVIKTKSNVVFKIVVNNRYNSSVADYIKEYWEKEMLCNVYVKVVDNIPLTMSGKRKFIINE